MQTPVVFFGSSQFSVIVLEKLLNAQGLSLCAVVTTLDQPAGRHLKLTPNPVKILAQKYNIPVFETMNDYRVPMNDNGMTIGLVAAFGKIIPQEIIEAFGGKIYNIHPSLLPEYRGPSPLQQQILDGLTQTGVTLIRLDALIDHGPIVAQKKDVVSLDDTTISLGERLFAKGADLFLSQLQKATPFKAKVQNHSLATYTKKLTRADGFVKFSELKDSPKNRQKFKAFYPWPGVWTLNPEGQRIKLISISPWQLRSYP